MTGYRCTGCTHEYTTQPEVCTCGSRSFATVTKPEPEPAKHEAEPKHHRR